MIRTIKKVITILAGIQNLLLFLVVGVVVFVSFDLIRPSKTPPNLVNHVNYASYSAYGTVEALHAGGRTEVVSVTNNIEITRYGDKLVLSGTCEQPSGRSGYFIPVMDCKVPDFSWQNSVQFIYSSEISYFIKETSDDRPWYEFRCANVVFRDGAPYSLQYTHKQFKNGVWKLVAEYQARFRLYGATFPENYPKEVGDK